MKCKREKRKERERITKIEVLKEKFEIGITGGGYSTKKKNKRMMRGEKGYEERGKCKSSEG